MDSQSSSNSNSGDENGAAVQIKVPNRVNRLEKDKRVHDRTDSSLKVLNQQLTRSLQDVSDLKFEEKQDMLLKMLCMLDPKLCLQDIAVQLQNCQDALKLLDEQKALVTDLHGFLEQQKLKVEVLSQEEEKMDKLKYCNDFPEGNELATSLFGFYSTNVEMLKSEHKRMKGFHALVKDSRHLSEQFVDFAANEVPGNKARLFLKVPKASGMKVGVVRASEHLKVWACDWSMTAHLNDSK